MNRMNKKLSEKVPDLSHLEAIWPDLRSYLRALICISNIQSQYLITPSQPAVAILLVSCGCHKTSMQTSS